ncbi:MAG: TrkH family potassium uptake protein [Deltaproteobacteria bacterium]|nr:TrkH family potassium uptake protein [Candidatus Anaeroferrophillus wilburensis]MBN2888069.1 TrkH family potassium uptake protein [Deltaproteobacteria bacterium]
MIKHVKQYLFILNYLGALLTIFGLLLFLPLFVQACYQEKMIGTHLFAAFALPGIGLILGGILMQKKIPIRIPTVKEGMMITALAWVSAAGVSSIPFIIGMKTPAINALFEATSGITASGLTVFTGLDSMPKCMLFWRSLLQWVGGVGILTFFLAVSFRGGSASATLFSAEGHKIAGKRPVPGIFNTVKIIWMIYGSLTLSCFVLLWLEGIPLFDAINHTLTVVSTGGFSTHDASISFFSAGRNGPLIEYTLIFFMLMGGINFLIHYKVCTGEWRALYRDYEIRWFWSILLGGTMLITIDHLTHVPGAGTWSPYHLHEVVRKSLFQVSSVLTSTGYATEHINNPFFPALAKQLFLLMMFSGACAGSTAGGYKLLRLGILWETLKSELIRSVSSPKRVVPVVIHGQVIANQEIRRITAVLFAWLMIIFMGAGVSVFFSDLNGWEAFSGMLSAVSNMGPHYFSVERLAATHPLVKSVYVIGMLVGRLEILPFLVLFSRTSWR